MFPHQCKNCFTLYIYSPLFHFICFIYFLNNGGSWPNDICIAELEGEYNNQRLHTHTLSLSLSRHTHIHTQRDYLPLHRITHASLQLLMCKPPTKRNFDPTIWRNHLHKIKQRLRETLPHREHLI